MFTEEYLVFDIEYLEECVQSWSEDILGLKIPLVGRYQKVEQPRFHFREKSLSQFDSAAVLHLRAPPCDSITGQVVADT